MSKITTLHIMFNGRGNSLWPDSFDAFDIDYAEYVLYRNCPWCEGRKVPAGLRAVVDLLSSSTTITYPRMLTLCVE